MPTTQAASPSAAGSPTVLDKLLEAMQRWWHRDGVRRAFSRLPPGEGKRRQLDPELAATGRHDVTVSTERRMAAGSYERPAAAAGKPGGRRRSLWDAYLSEPFVGTD